MLDPFGELVVADDAHLQPSWGHLVRDVERVEIDSVVQPEALVALVVKTMGRVGIGDDEVCRRTDPRHDGGRVVVENAGKSGILVDELARVHDTRHAELACRQQRIHQRDRVDVHKVDAVDPKELREAGDGRRIGWARSTPPAVGEDGDVIGELAYRPRVLVVARRQRADNIVSSAIDRREQGEEAALSPVQLSARKVSDHGDPRPGRGSRGFETTEHVSLLLYWPFCRYTLARLLLPSFAIF